jgi:hypothetical protein
MYKKGQISNIQMVITFFSKLRIDQESSHWKDIREENITINPEN